MSKFKVGDRIRVIDDYADGAEVLAGDLGTVVSIIEDSSYEDVRVLMDTPRDEPYLLKDPAGRDYHWVFGDRNLEATSMLGSASSTGVASTGPNLHAEFVASEGLLENLARASKEHDVMISFTVTPYGDE